MKKKFGLLLSILLVSISFLGCGGKEESKDVSKTEDGRTKIKVGAMGYYLSVPLAVIEDKKLDEKYQEKMEMEKKIREQIT